MGEILPVWVIFSLEHTFRSVALAGAFIILLGLVVASVVLIPEHPVVFVCCGLGPLVP